MTIPCSTPVYWHVYDAARFSGAACTDGLPASRTGHEHGDRREGEQDPRGREAGHQLAPWLSALAGLTWAARSSGSRTAARTTSTTRALRTRIGSSGMLWAAGMPSAFVAASSR